MTEQEILDKVLSKAVKNGYSALHLKEFGVENMTKMLMGDGYSLAGLLLSHPFAKAFWGNKMVAVHKNYAELVPEWKRRIIDMVQEENPLKYLEQFI